MTYGTLVKTLRLAKKWSQRQLAINANVSNTEISRIESGQRENPSLNTVKKLAKVFGYTPKDFLSQIGKDITNIAPKQSDDLNKLLNKFLNKTDVMFNGEIHNLNQDDKQKIKDALEYIFYRAKQRNKRKKD